jgi:acetyltransferase-like isoleucine patch superfamily enzyme
MGKNIHDKIMYSNWVAKITSVFRRYIEVRRSKFGLFTSTSKVRYPIRIKGIENVYMHENTSILAGALIIAVGGKFIIKKNSGAAEGLTVVTSNHPSPIGEWFYVTSNENIELEVKDVIIEEDVWIATNVTLLAGVTIGRGSICGSGAVVRNSCPPYSIVIGNPAKVIGFKFTPDEIIEHEKALYPEKERIPMDLLKENYERYFIKRIIDIRAFCK